MRKSIVSESDSGPCQVDDDGCEDESGEEHDGLEAAVPEEGARHAEHQVEAAYRRWGWTEMDCKSPHAQSLCIKRDTTWCDGLPQYPSIADGEGLHTGRGKKWA